MSNKTEPTSQTTITIYCVNGDRIELVNYPAGCEDSLCLAKIHQQDPADNTHWRDDEVWLDYFEAKQLVTALNDMIRAYENR